MCRKWRLKQIQTEGTRCRWHIQTAFQTMWTARTKVVYLKGKNVFRKEMVDPRLLETRVWVWKVIFSCSVLQ